MDINRGGVEGAVPQPLLQLERTDTSFRLERGERVPQRMRADPFGYARLSAVLGEQLLHAAFAQRLLIPIQKQVIAER